MRTLTGTGIGITLALVASMVGLDASFAQAPAPAPGQESKPEPTSKPDDTKVDVTGDIELTRAMIQVQRQALVTAAMDLEPKEAEVFWPLYREYRVEMAKVGDRFVRLLVSFLEDYDSLSDQAAISMLNEYLSIELARNSVKAQYVAQFQKALPARKVARFFQVDNKLDAFLNADLARQIPLAR